MAKRRSKKRRAKKGKRRARRGGLAFVAAIGRNTPGRRRRRKGKRKGHIPLPVLERRLKRLGKIVASRRK